jgi:hypothetical protein
MATLPVVTIRFRYPLLALLARAIGKVAPGLGQRLLRASRPEMRVADGAPWVRLL